MPFTSKKLGLIKIFIFGAVLQNAVKYGEGLSREARVRKAYEILSNAGYTWEVPPFDADGNLVEGKRGWNMSGYKNSDFDRIADESAGVMDIEKRRELIWEMQAIIMRYVPYFPLYNPRLTEGVRADRFKGWVEMLDGIGNIWSFCRIRPE